MINNNMKIYDYYTYDGENAYGQEVLSTDVKGTVKLAIYETSTSIQDNINYKDSQYIGLTLQKGINDNMVIQYGEIKLKVLYVSERGRFYQVFLHKI
jgi:hypothetical protein